MINTKTKKIKNSGFLLVEVLVALVILTVGLTVGIQALMYTRRMNNMAYKRSTAILLADSHLSQILMSGERIPEDGSKGELEEGFNWEIKVEQVNPSLDKITYIVSWKEKYATPRVELLTYHANPYNNKGG